MWSRAAQKFPILSSAEVRENPKVSLKKDAKSWEIIGQEMAAVPPPVSLATANGV